MLTFRQRLNIGLTRPAIIKSVRRCVEDKRCFRGMPNEDLIEQIAAEWMVSEMVHYGDAMELTLEDIKAVIEKWLPLILQLLLIIG